MPDRDLQISLAQMEAKTILRSNDHILSCCDTACSQRQILLSKFAQTLTKLFLQHKLTYPILDDS